MIKDKLLQAMQDYFAKDAKRINHACKVLGYAEQILAKEGGDREVVEAAAILHDIGIPAAEKKHGSNAGKYQEIEGPPIADNVLRSIGFPEEKIKEILEIIAHHHTPGKITTNNFKILYDADWLVNIKDEIDLKDKDKLARIIDRLILTPTGKELARRLYL